MENESQEIDKLVSQFTSSANTLQQAYLSLENELLDTFSTNLTESEESDSSISDSSIWEFRKNLIYVLEMLDHPVVVLNESMEIMMSNNPAKLIYQLSENSITTDAIFSKNSKSEISDFLHSGKETANKNLSIKTPIVENVKFELRRHIDNFTKGALVSVACVDDRLLQSQQVQGKIQMQNMIANLAHNIRTPMSAIVGYAQLLQRDLGENDKYTNKINFIFDGVQRIDRVISSLINYANEPAITNEVKYQLVPYLEQKKMIWSQEFNKEINLIIIEKSEFHIESVLNKRGLDSIFQNLILNSCEAVSGEIVDIKIKISMMNDKLALIISDTGEGMTSGNLNKCKEPFFTTRINGLGLGLSIVENLVLIMNGAINIKSALGEGTQIELTFPQENIS